MLREVLTIPWWTYDPQMAGGWGLAYRWFNLFEGAVWIVLGCLVLRRWLRCRRSRLEVAYGLTFVLFGLTDFREASVQTAALVAVKAIVLVVLFGVRYRVLRHHYPEHRLY